MYTLTNKWEALGKTSGDPRKQSTSIDQSLPFRDHREPRAGPARQPSRKRHLLPHLTILETCRVEGRTKSQRLPCDLHIINQPINKLRIVIKRSKRQSNTAHGITQPTTGSSAVCSPGWTSHFQRLCSPALLSALLELGTLLFPPAPSSRHTYPSGRQQTSHPGLERWHTYLRPHGPDPS